MQLSIRVRMILPIRWNPSCRVTACFKSPSWSSELSSADIRSLLISR